MSRPHLYSEICRGVKHADHSQLLMRKTLLAGPDKHMTVCFFLKKSTGNNPWSSFSGCPEEQVRTDEHAGRTSAPETSHDPAEEIPQPAHGDLGTKLVNEQTYTDLKRARGEEDSWIWVSSFSVQSCQLLSDSTVGNHIHLFNQ